jgi:hypothetical protein
VDGKSSSSSTRIFLAHDAVVAART